MSSTLALTGHNIKFRGVSKSTCSSCSSSPQAPGHTISLISLTTALQALRTSILEGNEYYVIWFNNQITEYVVHHHDRKNFLTDITIIYHFMLNIVTEDISPRCICDANDLLKQLDSWRTINELNYNCTLFERILVRLCQLPKCNSVSKLVNVIDNTVLISTCIPETESEYVRAFVSWQYIMYSFEIELDEISSLRDYQGNLSHLLFLHRRRCTELVGYMYRQYLGIDHTQSIKTKPKRSMYIMRKKKFFELFWKFMRDISYNISDHLHENIVLKQMVFEGTRPFFTGEFAVLVCAVESLLAVITAQFLPHPFHLTPIPILFITQSQPPPFSPSHPPPFSYHDSIWNISDTYLPVNGVLMDKQVITNRTNNMTTIDACNEKMEEVTVKEEEVEPREISQEYPLRLFM